MSFIGKLEQLNLSFILQGIETYGKTGLLVIKHEAQWVELYFRGGRLMCIGPVRSNATLSDRLLQAGVITSQALQEAQLTMGMEEAGETRIALTLMDLGYVTHEGLRAWATQEAVEVIQVLLTWQSGDIYFEDTMQPPSDRLLVAISPAALLPPVQSLSLQAQPGRIEVTPSNVQEAALSREGRGGAGLADEMRRSLQQEPQSPAQATSAPAFISVSELISETPVGSSSFSLPEARTPVLNPSSPFDGITSSPLSSPQRVTAPMQPVRIDTSFMRPEMVLLPVDLSSLREQNPQLPMTPDQWRLLTRADGRSTLLTISQELAMQPALVCQVAGELIALGVVRVALPMQQAIHELSPVSHELITAGLGNGYVTPGYAATSAQPWGAYTPITDALPPTFSPTKSLETKSQWGNGGNGASFVPGRGWIATPQPLQPVQPSGPLYSTQGVFAYVGERR